MRALAGGGLLVAVCALGAWANLAATPPTVGRVHRLDARLDAVVAPEATLEVVAEGFEWVEGPVWRRGTASLYVSDVPRNAILEWRPGHGVREVKSRSGYTGAAPFPGREPGSNGLAFDREGRLIVCQHGDRRVVRYERDGSVSVLADRYHGRRLNSPNDLVVLDNGDLYFTDPPFGLPRTFDDPAKELPFQGVFHLTASGTLRAVVTDLEGPNGVALSPDGRTLYVSHARPARPVWMAYDVGPDGGVSRPREFAHARDWVSAGDGLPDGMKTDVRGHLFATGPGGIHVFAPDGTRLGRIETGAPTGNVAWGDDGSVLYVAANHRLLRLRTRTNGLTAGGN